MNTDFRTSMRQAGLDYAGPLEPDGKLHRVKVEGDHARNSWYVLHAGPPQAGAFGCWKRGFSEVWCDKNGKEFSRDEWAGIRQRWKEAERERKRAEAEAEAAAGKTADWVLAHSDKVSQQPYLARKGVAAYGELRQYQGALVVPLRDREGKLRSVQFIRADGSKRFLRGGRVAGSYFMVSGATEAPLVICEGYATGASIHNATGWAVVCAMHCGNLLPVAKAIRASWPDREIIIGADHDQFTDGNPGLTKATEAAKAIKAHVALPEFADEALADKPTDFNDLHRLAGLEAVRRQIERANPIMRALLDREFRPGTQPPPLQPIYTLAGTCISTPGNLTTITAAIKTGKSAVIGAMAAAAMPHPEGADLLGFASCNPGGLGLVWLDSEQSPDDSWHCVNRAVRRARLDGPPAWLHAYCLTGLAHKTAWSCAERAIRLAAERHGGLHSIFLDGAADFVADVNDPDESNAFVAMIHGLAIKHSCPIVSVIHFNPGKDKSRGHLGSQLERKAETNLTLEKDSDEITVIFSVKNRRASIPKRYGPRFAWSKQEQMHVSVESASTAKAEQERKELARLAESVFAERPSMRRADLETTFKKRLKVSESSAYRKVEAMIEYGIIKKSVAGLYVNACPAES